MTDLSAAVSVALFLVWVVMICLAAYGLATNDPAEVVVGCCIVALYLGWAVVIGLAVVYTVVHLF